MRSFQHSQFLFRTLARHLLVVWNSILFNHFQVPNTRLASIFHCQISVCNVLHVEKKRWWANEIQFVTFEEKFKSLNKFEYLWNTQKVNNELIRFTVWTNLKYSHTVTLEHAPTPHIYTNKASQKHALTPHELTSTNIAEKWMCVWVCVVRVWCGAWCVCVMRRWIDSAEESNDGSFDESKSDEISDEETSFREKNLFLTRDLPHVWFFWSFHQVVKNPPGNLLHKVIKTPPRT